MPPWSAARQDGRKLSVSPEAITEASGNSSALPGQLTQLVDGEIPRLIGTLDNSTKIDAILGNGWVETHIIAKNNVLIHITNGHVTSVVLDDDDKNRPTEGVLALHAHPGPPMKVEFRNIRLKTITP